MLDHEAKQLLDEDDKARKRVYDEPSYDYETVTVLREFKVA